MKHGKIQSKNSKRTKKSQSQSCSRFTIWTCPKKHVSATDPDRAAACSEIPSEMSLWQGLHGIGLPFHISALPFTCAVSPFHPFPPNDLMRRFCYLVGMAEKVLLLNTWQRRPLLQRIEECHDVDSTTFSQSQLSHHRNHRRVQSVVLDGSPFSKDDDAKKSQNKSW